jgi:hypothetical protein
MLSKRNDQPTFFDLAVQQRGAANRVLQTLNAKWNSLRPRRVGHTYGIGGRQAGRVGVL